MYDVIIIGSGPAGYTAGIYAIRSGLSVLILEGENWGGQLMTTTTIENYPGFVDGVNGFELMNSMREQCIKQGCKVLSEIVTTMASKDIHIVSTTNTDYTSRSVIIATGAYAKKLDIPGGDTFWNKGISACAVCDGALPMFRNKPIAVVGGGDTACEEASFLSSFGSIVYMLVRGNKMRASEIMQKRVLSNPKITVMFDTHVVEATGDGILREIITNTGKLEVSGLFYAIGHIPNSEPFEDVKTDADGYIITDNTKTNVVGVFACGDVQDKIYRQAITAAASGCQAAMEAYKYLNH